MFFLLPVGVDYAPRRAPVVTYTFLGLNVLIYLFSWMALASGGFDGEMRFVEVLGLKPAHVTAHGFVTSLFTQVGLFHLLGNLVYLYLFGACVEDLIGRWQFVLFFLLGGLAADFLHIAAALANGTAEMPLIGASGAISACLGGFVVLLKNTKINFRYFVWFLVRAWDGDFWLPAWLVISFWFLMDLISAVGSVVGPGRGGGVAFAAHVGGFIGGFLMMLAWRGVRSWAGERGEAANVPAPAPARVPTRVTPRVAPVPATAAVKDEPATVYLHENGVQSGPFPPGQVRRMLAAGGVSPEAVYWREGMAEWRSVAEWE